MDAVFDHAVENGAVPSMPVTNMFWGDRIGMLKDPFGHLWAVATHREDVSPERLQKGAEEFFGQFATASR